MRQAAAARPRIDPGEYRKIVVLTGAGISVASGIRPFRGPGGLWNDEKIVKYSDYYTFLAEPLETWKFWWSARSSCLAAEPNAAHIALARLEAGLRKDQEFCLITQNIDGLHARAGSRKVVEYHGNVLVTRCSNPSCSLEPFADEAVGGDATPLCPLCGSRLRPDIVMFSEAIPEGCALAAEEAIRGCELFIAVGTSGTVYPAAGFVHRAAYEGARTVYVNLESLSGREIGSGFGEECLGRAEEVLPALLGMD
jgi:NAD-dependent deacetylase